MQVMLYCWYLFRSYRGNKWIMGGITSACRMLTLALIWSFAAAAMFLTPCASTLSDVMLSRYLRLHTGRCSVVVLDLL